VHREVHQTGICVTKTARIEIERAKSWLEVHMKPLATGFSGADYGQPHKFASDSSTLMTSTSLRVKEERMISTIPGDVDEPDQEAASATSTDPAETVCADPVPPPDNRVAAVRKDKVDHLFVSHNFSPGIGNRVRHTPSLPDIRRVSQAMGLESPSRVDAAMRQRGPAAPGTRRRCAVT
jgi:hypothetical protein